MGRRDLQLQDAEGTVCLPNAAIFEELARISAAADKVVTTVGSVEGITDATTPQISMDDVTLAQTLIEIKAKYKGKGIMVEPKKPLKKKDKITFDEEVTRKKLAEQLQAQEREHLSIKERSKLLAKLIESKRKYFAAKRAEEIRNKPPTKDQKNQAEVTKGSSKRAGYEIEQESAKRQRLKKEGDTAELKRCLEIVHEDDDDLSWIYPIQLSFNKPDNMANENVPALAPALKRSNDTILPFGIITRTNIDYAKLMWEEFVQAIHTFLVDKANLGSPTKKGKKSKPYVIPYSRFTKLIVYYLVKHLNIHQRFGSLLNLAEDDLSLGNLKFVPKGEIDKVFRMKIPEDLITDNIKNEPYYYMPILKSSLQLVNELDEEYDQPEVVPEPQGACEEYDLEREIQMSLESFQAQGQAHVGSVSILEPVAEATHPLLVVKDAKTGADTEKVISKSDTEILNIGKEQEEDVDNQVYLEEQMAKLDEGQAGLDLVHESLKFLADEQVILEDPPSSSGTLFSMKNLDDTYTFRDQFFNDKSTIDKPRKQNVDAKVVSMVTVPIHQSFTLVPPFSTPIIDLSPPKPTASPLPKSFTTTTTETTTTTLPLPKSQTLDNATQNLGFKVFNLELQDSPHKINQTVNEVVKEAVHIALQAPLRDHFRELPEADMKEIHQQRMFESGSYKSIPKHVALYEALEASMKQENRDEFLAERTCLPLAPQSSTWKVSDTREALSNSNKQQSAPHSKQPVEDVPIPDDVNISDLGDTDAV
nr:hypothetical protein [Tanacetum cinerariifolium]